LRPSGIGAPLIVLAAALSLAAQAPEAAGRKSAPVTPEGIRARLTALLPPAADLGGKPAKAPSFFMENLYKYLDGGAEAYLSKGFVALIHQDYRVGRVELTIDVYDMGGAERANKIFTAERPPDCRGVAIGAEGYADEGTLNFRMDRYYVKLTSFGDSEKNPAIEKAARAVETRIESAK